MKNTIENTYNENLGKEVRRIKLLVEDLEREIYRYEREQNGLCRIEAAQRKFHYEKQLDNMLEFEFTIS